MKKIIFAVLAALLLPGISYAAGTVAVTNTNTSDSVYVLTFTATADASDGSYPVTTAAPVIDGLVCRVIVDPDDTATPTDNYDATITDQYGIDIMEGLLTNLDTTAVTAVDFVPTVNSGTGIGCVLVPGSLTLTLTGNSVNSAVTVVRVIYIR